MLCRLRARDLGSTYSILHSADSFYFFVPVGFFVCLVFSELTSICADMIEYVLACLYPNRCSCH